MKDPHRFQRKEKPIACPFCEALVPRPQVRNSAVKGTEIVAGSCSCGAVYLADLTGKGGGEALMEGLTLLTKGDTEQALHLEQGVDYQMARLGYRPVTHSLEPRLPGRGAYGRPKLWFFCRIAKQEMLS